MTDLIDPKTIAGLLELDDHEGELLRQLVELFVVGGPARVAAIADAVSRGDLKRLNSEAHSLKSSAANLGALGMAVLCQRLENVRDPAAVAAVRDLPAELKSEYERVIERLKVLASTSGKV